MFSVLRDMYGVKLQAYHDGCLTGKDIQKVMSNASEIFSCFARKLKGNNKPDSMEDHTIDAM